MLKWFHHSCSKKVRYPQLHRLVMENTHINMLTGFMRSGDSPHTNGKWYAPPFMLTELEGSTYPNFLSGTAYVMSYTTAELLYRTSLTVPVFHLEDVYLTGFLPSAYNRLLRENKLELPFWSTFDQNKNVSLPEKEIHPTNDDRFKLVKVRNMQLPQYAKLISSHGFEPHEVLDLHKKMEKLKNNLNKSD